MSKAPSKPARERILYAIKSGGAQNARDLAAELGITPQAVQQQLAQLGRDGLVAWQDRRQPRGRPLRYWSLTEKGHARFPDRHSDLTVELLASVCNTFGNDGLDRLIEVREAETLARYRRELAERKSTAERVAGLAGLRTREGYMADWRKLDDGAFLLIENHCPICAAATVCQGLCRSEQRLFQSVLGDAVSVERTDHIVAGARRCAYRIKPRKVRR